MRKRLPVWVIGLTLTLAVILVPLIAFWPQAQAAPDDPRAAMAPTPVPISHADIIKGPFSSPQDVTRACLTCHPTAASGLMKTSHWTWESRPFNVPWRDHPVTIGKVNQLNNFCIGTQGNQRSCMSCHTGYGWQENVAYDFQDSSNVDCLVCHADPADYAKGDFGNPANGVDLLAAARSVRAPTRENCGKCHFDGGGGNGVKHGDLDESLIIPSPQLDVHMGGANMQCTDCHTTKDHQILGRIVADNYAVDPGQQAACTQCHSQTPHQDERLNAHGKSVACQTCHIPSMAVKDPTKLFWDWSTAGQDRPEDHYTYLKIKGSFIYATEVRPTYAWFNGNLAYRYLLGDTIDAAKITDIDLPAGGIDDSSARIFPFKVHLAKQPYDTANDYLLQPVTAGTNGYWTNFDWNNAFRLAEPLTGLKYSGNYGFTETRMYWPTTHMVQPKENALQCTDCHSENGRLDWQALGYPGDPMSWGGRFDTK